MPNLMPRFPEPPRISDAETARWEWRNSVVIWRDALQLMAEAMGKLPLDRQTSAICETIDHLNDAADSLTREADRLESSDED